MRKRTIILNPSKCDGCGECEKACSVKRSGLMNPALSCIHVINDEKVKGFYLPIICMQCSDPPCLAVCPREAIFQDNDLNRVMIDENRCIGCKMCVAACPFGAMGFDEDRGHAFKCDLCEGDPECVRCCEPKALLYIESDILQVQQIQTSVDRFYAIIGQGKFRRYGPIYVNGDIAKKS